jgi:hypothetical protein
MEDLEKLSNNDILFKIKQMQADYESVKLKMLRNFDELLEIENSFNKANILLSKRLKGE